MKEIKSITEFKLTDEKVKNSHSVMKSAKFVDKDGNFHVINHASQNIGFIKEQLRRRHQNNEKTKND